MVTAKTTGSNDILANPKLILALKVLLALICLYFAIYFLILKDKNSKDDAFWQQTKTDNTLNAYQNYLDSHSSGQHRDRATENIIRIKQDTLNYDKAVGAGTYQALKYYSDNCKNTECKHTNQIQKIIKTVNNISNDFNHHLKVNNLSTGRKGHTLQDIDNYKKILPNDSKIKVWQQLVGKKFQNLADKALSQQNLKKAKIYAAKAEKLLGKSKLNTTTELIANKIEQKAIKEAERKAKIEKFEKALIEGNIDLIKDYVATCTNCPKLELAKTKLKSYEKINKKFNANLKNDRLTKGKNHTAANLADLKNLFKKPKQASIWAQKISDKFYDLAAKEKNNTKSSAYISKGLEFAVNAEKLNALKASNKTKQSNQQNYKNMQKTKTIKSAETYITACKPDTCDEYTKIKTKITDAKSISKKFDLHIKNSALTKGTDGFALDDIAKLKALFSGDPAINQWQSRVIDKFLSLVDGALQKKQYAKARGYLASAFGIQKNDPQLKLMLAKLSKISPQYAIHTKGSKLIPAMVYFPAKTFNMGGKFKQSKPIHSVNIKPFRISKNEISFQKYLQFAKANKIKVNSNYWGLGNRPAINVSWYNANAYVKWLSKKTRRKFRLPSEAEWEYAASNLTSNKSKLCQYANGADKSSSSSALPWKNHKCRDGYSLSTAPVGSFKSNAFGLNDTAGNVWEWVYDCWHYNFKGAPKTGKAWTAKGDCRYRMIKGGGWNSSTDFMSPQYRTKANPNVRYNYIGFRIVEDI